VHLGALYLLPGYGIPCSSRSLRRHRHDRDHCKLHQLLRFPAGLLSQKAYVYLSAEQVDVIRRRAFSLRMPRCASGCFPGGGEAGPVRAVPGTDPAVAVIAIRISW
jgi:hypothetical protein